MAFHHQHLTITLLERLKNLQFREVEVKIYHYHLEITYTVPQVFQPT